MTQLRVRARAVDMLGRQQIAGIPTAIHELFKNAHDAYAERVEVDYFRRTRVLVLRDDGYGMTRHDVENRWLTLGTESRINANRGSIDTDEDDVQRKEREWRGPKNPSKRSIMGEKGIGRLAIAVIAPITILLSRASRPDGLKNLVVALVHWGLFEQPGLDVSAIDVPLKEFPGGTLPTKEDINHLADEVAKNLKSLKSELTPEAFMQLNEDLNKVRIIAPDLLDNKLNSDRSDPLTLTGDGYGTHFIVLPVALELDDDIDGGSDKESSKLERNLLGFSNAMTFDETVIKTEFRDHLLDGFEERIGPKSFFGSEDFSKTDQYFEGEFDEYGQFVGTVSIYGQPKKFVCNWADGKGRTSRCGPFSFRYGYVQGRSNESRLSPEDWAEMTAKTERVGGLYIYRDGIRVLPYGNSDVDWLDIEKRRTLSAKDWFFSYRRGFGYVAISHSVNGTLTEKAGREGFRENLAYRDFRSILVNFFKQLAYEFFKPNATQGDYYTEGKATLVAQADLLKRQKEKADSRRKIFQKELEVFFDYYNRGYFESESSRVKSFIGDKLELIESELDLGDFVSRVRLLEMDSKQLLRALNNKTVINLPRGLSLTKNLLRDWASYEVFSSQIRNQIIVPLRAELDDLFLKATEGRVSDFDRRRVALEDVERERDTAVRDLVVLRRETIGAVSLLQGTVQQVLKEDFTELRARIEELVDDFAKRSAESPGEIDRVQHDVEQQINQLRNSEAELLDSFKRQMIELAEGAKERETLDDRFAALEARNQVLEEQVDFYSDFAQMGMSVGILQHEFERAARGIRVAMSELKPWADRNAPLSGIYKSLREHIEHLDGYLKVLDPLGRRLHRSTVEVSGEEILGVLRRVFVEQLSDSRIDMIASEGFRKKTVEGRSSALLGAFINVVDNAIYWLSNRAEGERKILLDTDGTGFTVANTGPGIEARIRDRIFDFGETNKPGGKGMGLAISRESLRREGFDISLETVGLGVGPVFRISPMDKEAENEI